MAWLAVEPWRGPARDRAAEASAREARQNDGCQKSSVQVRSEIPCLNLRFHDL